MIRQQIGAGCDAIVCAPNDAGAAQGALQAAIDAGIPVLAVDTTLCIAGQTSFVGTPTWTLLIGRQVGHRAGRYRRQGRYHLRS